MVIVELLVGIGSEISVLIDTSALENICSRTVDRRSQTDLLKIMDRTPDHSLEAKTVTYIYRLLDRDILISHLETDPVSFRVCVRHQRNLFFRHPIKMCRRTQLILRHILAVIIQIAQVCQVTLLHDAQGKIFIRTDKLRYLLAALRLIIIAHIPVQDLL